MQHIRKIVNLTKKTNKEIKCLKREGGNTNEPIGIANSFNVHSSSVAKKIEKKIHKQP